MAKQNKKILVVDDLPDWRKTLRGLLEDEGYEVEVAESRHEALSLLIDNSFVLAIIDIRLEESDENNIEGINLASEINKTHPGTKIIIITGYGTLETVEESMRDKNQNGKLAADFVLKDETDSLISTVRKVLAQESI